MQNGNLTLKSPKVPKQKFELVRNYLLRSEKANGFCYTLEHRPNLDDHSYGFVDNVSLTITPGSISPFVESMLRRTLGAAEEPCRDDSTQMMLDSNGMLSTGELSSICGYLSNLKNKSPIPGEYSVSLIKDRMWADESDPDGHCYRFEFPSNFFQAEEGSRMKLMQLLKLFPTK